MCLRTANRPWGLGSDLQQEAEDKLFAICRLKDETKPDPWPHPASPRLTPPHLGTCVFTYLLVSPNNN